FYVIYVLIFFAVLVTLIIQTVQNQSQLRQTRALANSLWGLASWLAATGMLGLLVFFEGFIEPYLRLLHVVDRITLAVIYGIVGRALVRRNTATNLRLTRDMTV